MARATLTTQNIVRSGLNATYTSTTAADGVQFTNSGVEFLHVKNDTDGPIVATIVTTVTVDDDLDVPDRTVTVPAGEARFIGPFQPSYYGSTVTVNFDADGADVALLKRP